MISKNAAVQHARAYDAAKMRGDLQIVVRSAKTNKILRQIAVKNTITYRGLNAPLYLLAQDGIVVADYRITQLWAGTNSTPPSRSDIGLGSALPTDPSTGGLVTLSAANRSISEPTSELLITASLDTAHANGYSLSEVGLFLANGQMFARQVHPTIPKTGAITVSYSWRIATTAITPI